MGTLEDLQGILSRSFLERAQGLGKKVDILNPDETIKNSNLDAIVWGPIGTTSLPNLRESRRQNENRRLSGAIQVDIDIVFEVFMQAGFTLEDIEPHLLKVRYPITDGEIYEIVHVEMDDVDPAGVPTVAVLFGKKALRGIGELPR